MGIFTRIMIGPLHGAMEFRVELCDSDPPIWRTIAAPASLSLHEFHMAIQGAMRWTNSHLHRFTKNGVEYGPFEAWEEGTRETDHIKIGEQQIIGSLFDGPGEIMLYLYDFGDRWAHLIEFLHRVPKPRSMGDVCVCTEGENACPPEDSGSYEGYIGKLQVLADQLDNICDKEFAADRVEFYRDHGDSGRYFSEADELTDWFAATQAVKEAILIGSNIDEKTYDTIEVPMEWDRTLFDIAKQNSYMKALVRYSNYESEHGEG